MALRFKVADKAIPLAGVAIAHSLGATPDEVWVCPAGTGVGCTVYRYAASDATNVYISCGTAAQTADVYAVVNHSIIK
jgi:tRNA/tmRNA/rRNA uracil-C5-methylase (TrmA/RlmC/RlmD family)